MHSKIHIGVIGAGECSSSVYEVAYEVGHLIVQNVWILICGGLGGVMEGVAKGCFEGGGFTIGLLPGTERE